MRGDRSVLPRHLGGGASGTGPDGRKVRPIGPAYKGEVTEVGTCQLIGTTRLGADDVFVDFGSGVRHVSLAAPDVRCIGIESAGARQVSVCEALQGVKACGLFEPERCVRHRGDVHQADLENKTTLFAPLASRR
jgi:hypothetical protein